MENVTSSTFDTGVLDSLYSLLFSIRTKTSKPGFNNEELAPCNGLTSRFDEEDLINTCLKLIQTEIEQSLYTSILLHLKIDPDPRAFLVSQVFEALIRFAVGKPRLEKKLEILFESILNKITLAVERECCNSQALSPAIFRRNKYWLFYRVLEAFLAEEGIESEKKQSLSRLIRKTVSSAAVPSAYGFPCTFVEICCGGFTATQWKELVQKELNQVKKGPPLTFLYCLAKTVRETQTSGNGLEDLAAVIYQTIWLSTKAITSSSPKGSNPNGIRIQWRNLQSEWCLTFLVVLNNLDTSLERNLIRKYRDKLSSIIPESDNFIDMIDASDISLFR